jgi:hypothetical protein
MVRKHFPSRQTNGWIIRDLNKVEIPRLQDHSDTAIRGKVWRPDAGGTGHAAGKINEFSEKRLPGIPIDLLGN